MSQTVTAKLNSWLANLIAAGVVAMVSSHIWLLVIVTSLSDKVTRIDAGSYTASNAATDKAIQNLTDAKQDATVNQIGGRLDDMQNRVNKNANDIGVLQNKVR